MLKNLAFIIVDDDPLNNLLCSMTIEKYLHTDRVLAFTLPDEALAFIQTTYNANSDPTILFLDINMPIINGWEFLEEYENFSGEIKNRIIIYLLSSSLYHGDISRAAANKNVKDFITKPLDGQTILKIAESWTHNPNMGQPK